MKVAASDAPRIAIEGLARSLHSEAPQKMSCGNGLIFLQKFLGMVFVEVSFCRVCGWDLFAGSLGQISTYKLSLQDQ